MEKENNEMWVFLSHSHKDYDKVSLVRDLLEKRGYKPIMFYLKCLDDDSEIDNLIKREIDCRAYFILCDSRNSRMSTWVREEESYIKDKGRIYEIVDIESDASQIETAISRFEQRTSFFISYSRHDAQTARIMERELNEKGYSTWIDFDNLDSRGVDFKAYIKNTITKYSNEGFVVVLLSRRYIESEFCMKELQMALGERMTNVSSILLVALDGIKPSDIPELHGLPVRWIDGAGCDVKQVAKKVICFFDFYNTSYRKVYNLCWEMSRIKYVNGAVIQDLPNPLPDNVDKTMVACRYILGLNAPTDIGYAFQLLMEEAKHGKREAIKILEISGNMI